MKKDSIVAIIFVSLFSACPPPGKLGYTYSCTGKVFSKSDSLRLDSIQYEVRLTGVEIDKRPALAQPGYRTGNGEYYFGLDTWVWEDEDGEKAITNIKIYVSLRNSNYKNIDTVFRADTLLVKDQNPGYTVFHCPDIYMDPIE